MTEQHVTPIERIERVSRTFRTRKGADNRAADLASAYGAAAGERIADHRWTGGEHKPVWLTYEVRPDGDGFAVVVIESDR